MRSDPLYSLALELDQSDPLASFRDRFHLPPDIIYLDGNSLGASPKAVRKRLNHLVEHEWGQRLIRGWNDGWVDLPCQIGAKIATLIGADADEVIVCDSTSVNFYKLAYAALKVQSGREGVIAEQIGFPTNNYILQGLVGPNQLRYVDSPDGISIPAESVVSLLNPKIALLTLNHVNFRSGWLHDMGQLNAAAKENGVLNLWDLSHSVGAIPIDVHASGTDLAVGCTYKYLNGGPGSPAFLYIRRELQKSLGNPIQGWFGQKDFFEFSEDYEPEIDIRRFLAGTPSILSMTAVDVGVDLVLEAGIDCIRKKSVLMTEFLLKVWRETLAPIEVRLNSPEDANQRGSHISLGHDRALGIDHALIQRMGVIPDFRKPDNIRFGLSPLYNRFVDVYEGLDRMRVILENKSYESFEPHSGQIT